MRTAVTLSLPKDLLSEINSAIKDLHFDSRSDFFRHITREWLAGRRFISSSPSIKR